MGIIKFRGLRGISTLFGLLEPRSTPNELNTEDPITQVYVTNEGIREETGRIYRLITEITVDAAETTDTAVINPFTAAPPIPGGLLSNLFLIRAGFSAVAELADFNQLHMVLFEVPTMTQGTAPAAASNPIGDFGRRTQFTLAGLQGPAEIYGGVVKMPQDGLNDAGAGNELRLNLFKDAGSSDFVYTATVDFWAAPPGVTCPWI